MLFFKKEEKTNQCKDVQDALKRYQAALMAFAQARDDAAVDYAIYEMEAAHREYALLSAAERAKEKTSPDCDVHAEHTVV